jgi:hypothetical protein
LRLEEQNIPVVKLQLKLALEWKIVRHSLFPVYFHVAALKIEQFQLTWAQFDMPVGKAAEGRRSPRRKRFSMGVKVRDSVVECGGKAERDAALVGCWDDSKAKG